MAVPLFFFNSPLQTEQRIDFNRSRIKTLKSLEPTAMQMASRAVQPNTRNLLGLQSAGPRPQQGGPQPMLGPQQGLPPGFNDTINNFFPQRQTPGSVAEAFAPQALPGIAQPQIEQQRIGLGAKAATQFATDITPEQTPALGFLGAVLGQTGATAQDYTQAQQVVSGGTFPRPLPPNIQRGVDALKLVADTLDMDIQDVAKPGTTEGIAQREAEVPEGFQRSVTGDRIRREDPVRAPKNPNASLLEIGEGLLEPGRVGGAVIGAGARFALEAGLGGNVQNTDINRRLGEGESFIDAVAGSGEPLADIANPGNLVALPFIEAEALAALGIVGAKILSRPAVIKAIAKSQQLFEETGKVLFRQTADDLAGALARGAPLEPQAVTRPVGDAAAPPTLPPRSTAPSQAAVPEQAVTGRALTPDVVRQAGGEVTGLSNQPDIVRRLRNLVGDQSPETQSLLRRFADGEIGRGALRDEGAADVVSRFASTRFDRGLDDAAQRGLAEGGSLPGRSQRQLDDELAILSQRSGVPLEQLEGAPSETIDRAFLREALSETPGAAILRDAPRVTEVAPTRAVEPAPIGPAATDAAQAPQPVAGAAAVKPVTPTGSELPEIGRTGIIDALNLKEETLLKPGGITQVPGIKQVVSGLNPSVSIDRQVLVSFNARQAVSASLETEFAATRHSVIRGLQDAWDAAPPRYKGPKNNAIKNTIKDWADNPDFYDGVGPALRSAARAYDEVSNQLLARTRGEFGVDISAFSSSKEGSFYLPTVQSREALEESLEKVSGGYTSASVSGKSSVSKTRVYDGAYQRSVRNPQFRAETDLAELTSLHDRALSSMASNETFKLGAGGRTRLDVMQELHPKLYDKMIGLRRRMENLRGTAGRLNERMRVAIDDFLAAPDGDLRDLAESLDVTVTRGRNRGANVRAINEEVKNVRQEIRALRPAWDAANLEPFVMNRKTFRFMEPEKSAAVDRILQTKLPIGDGLLQAIDEVRLFAFAGDISPLSIQGMMGIMSDPITGARSLPGVMRTLLRPENITEIAAREPEVVARFTQSTGRPFGQLGSEFVQHKKGLERIPGARDLNDRLMSAVELIRYNQWKTDTSMLRKLNPSMTEAVADAESANALSKVIPALNASERGAAVLQSRLERLPVISTSFIGGPATMVKDAASGMAKLTVSRALSPQARWTALAGREQLAIIHLASMTGSLATLSIGTHIASGWSPKDAVEATMNPNSPRFLTIALGRSRRIPIGGPLRSTAKAFLPQKVGEAGGVPVYAPFTGIPRWLQNKVTPAITTPIDLAQNKDYWGGKIGTGSFPESALRMVWYGVNNVLPLAISEPSEALRTGEAKPTDVGRLAELSGAQFAGVDLRATSPFEQTRFKRDEIAEQLFGAKYDALDQTRQAEVDRSPQLASLQGEIDALPPRNREGEGFDALAGTRTAQTQEQETDDTLLEQRRQTGEDGIDAEKWREDNTERKRSFFDRREQIVEDFGLDFERTQGKAPSNKIDAAIDAYFSVDVDEFTNVATKETDWGGFFEAREKALATLTDADRQRVMDYLNRPEIRTETEQAFQSDQETIGEKSFTYKGVTADYFDVWDTLWEQMQPEVERLLPGVKTRRDLDEAADRFGGEKANSIRNKLGSFVTEMRKRMVGSDPELDAVLVRWGYRDTLQFRQESFDVWNRLYPDAVPPRASAA